MFWDYVENILMLSGTIIGLLLSLFQYISSKKRGWIYPVIIFLCCLVSCYYWTSYLLIMGEDPDTASVFSYVGWVTSFFLFIPFVIHFKSPQERRYFHPLMLLPIPLNLYQLTLYLPFGGQLISVLQVISCTTATCFCIQSFCWYWKKRADGAPFPYVALAVLPFECFEFGMWTFSCFDEPIRYMYYVCSILCSLDYLFIVWAVRKVSGADEQQNTSEAGKKLERILKTIYFFVVFLCALGGIQLGRWMRDIIATSAQDASHTFANNIIPVILFIFSLVIAAFAIAIILVVSLTEKAAESSRLREEKAVAEQSNAAKSDFLASMSHEIRTPINAMLGMNEIILRESLQARDRLPGEREAVRSLFGNICTYAGNIESAGNSLLSIINDILDFSRIEAGKLEIKEGNYKLGSVLNDVSNMIIFKSMAKGLEFHVDVDSSLPDGLYGDELRVRQILTNLLNNAVKYTDSGHVSLRVWSAGEGPDENSVILCVSVQDTGIGILPEDMDRMFRKFERVNLERNRTIEGTGLGLAITRQLLKLMGGSIQVKSTYGEGSEFTVYIPQKIVSHEPVGNFRRKFEESIRKARARKTNFRAPQANILIVDDTPMNLMVATSLLKNTELSIDTAGSGAEAVQMSCAKQYDIILMDQRMPMMDGTEAMRRIKKQEDSSNRDTPVICLTADAVNGAKEHYIAEGFTDYLTKPIDSRALEQMLVKYLPEEKVIPVREETAGASPEIPDGPTGDEYALLRQAGVDTAVGLGYCRNNDSLYRSLLIEYANGSAEKAQEIRRYYEQKDWKNYRIQVHSLKSTSRMIGASAIADAAAVLESAADEGREPDLAAGCDSLLSGYEAIAEAIRKAFPAEHSENTVDENEPAELNPETYILEFAPENDDIG